MNKSLFAFDGTEAIYNDKKCLIFTNTTAESYNLTLQLIKAIVEVKNDWTKFMDWTCYLSASGYLHEHNPDPTTKASYP